MNDGTIVTHIRILNALAGWDIPSRASVCSADAEAGAGGTQQTPAAGGSATSTTTSTTTTPAVPEGYLSKDAVGKIIQDRIGNLSKEKEALDAKVKELSSKLEDIEHKSAIAGKPEHEAKAIEAQREAQRLARELEAKNAEIAARDSRTTAAETTLRDYVARNEITAALAPSVVGSSLADAVELMNLHTKPKVEIGSDGKHRVIYTVGGMEIASAPEAAKQWLATRPHLVKHPGGGSGNPGNVNGAGASVQLDQLSPGALLSMGLATKPA